MKVTIQKRIEVEDIPDQVLEKAEEILTSLQDDVFISLRHLCNQIDKHRGNLNSVNGCVSQLDEMRATLQGLIDNFEDLSNFLQGYQNVLDQLETPPQIMDPPSAPDIAGLVEKVADLKQHQADLEGVAEAEEKGEQ